MRKYLVINTSEIDKIDFSQIIQSDESQLIQSLNGEKTFIKWELENPDPTFLVDFIFKEGPYNNEEIIQIISSSEWYVDSLL